jgi:hypothetical protein
VSDVDVDNPGGAIGRLGAVGMARVEIGSVGPMAARLSSAAQKLSGNEASLSIRVRP